MPRGTPRPTPIFAEFERPVSEGLREFVAHELLELRPVSEMYDLGGDPSMIFTLPCCRRDGRSACCGERARGRCP